ncbi:MAG: MoaD/ThiS family protein [Candidatus Tectomicrobia bacterium]
MALVFIPTMMQNLTAGETQVRVEGKTLRQLINNLEGRFPGIRERLLQDDDIRPDVAVAVDGEVAFNLMERVSEESEVHFVPPISGGV